MDEPQLPLWAFVGGLVAATAVVLEVAGSAFGTAVATSYPGWLVPAGWPTALRTAWWLIAAAGVVAANRGMAVASGRSRRFITIIATTPFVAFALGIATGQEWATFH